MSETTTKNIVGGTGGVEGRRVHPDLAGLVRRQNQHEQICLLKKIKPRTNTQTQKIKYPNPKNETRKTKNKNQIRITGTCCSSSSSSSVVLDSDKPSIKDNNTSLSLSHNVESIGVMGFMIADLSLDLLWIGWVCCCCEPNWLGFSGFVCLFNSMSRVGQVG